MKKTKTRLLVSYMLLIGLFFSIQGIAQDYLHVPTHQFNQLDNESFCVKIYVNNITRQNGTGGFTDNNLTNQVNLINSYFANTGISFSWDENINTVNNDDIFNNFEPFVDSGSCGSTDFSPLNNYSHSDGIDLFFINKNLSGSYSDRVGSGTRVIYSRGALDTYVLGHELGHVFGLFHPWHGTIGLTDCENADGFQNHVLECVDQTVNAIAAGDYVYDTKADAKHPQVITNTCNPTSESNDVDSCGEPFGIPDLDNMMSFWSEDCNTKIFTTGQKRRMKYFLWEAGPVPTIPLHSTVVDCPVIIDPPGPCENCNGAESAADAVFATHDDTIINCNQYTISLPFLSLDCDDTFTVTWHDGTSETLNGNNPSTNPFTFSESTSYPVTIKVNRPNQDCDTFMYTINVDLNCDDNPPPVCDDCPTVAQEIIDTVMTTITSIDNCTKYKLTVPEISDCYVGFVNWGDGASEQLISNTVMMHQYMGTTNNTYDISVSLSTDGETRTCGIASTNVSVTCPPVCENPCNIDATFEYSQNNCNYTFDGNDGNISCGSNTYTYEWKVNGYIVGNQEDLTVEFPGSGAYTIYYKIEYSDGTRTCHDEYTRVINVNCSTPPCLPSEAIFIMNEGGGGLCTTAHAKLQLQYQTGVSHVNWSWALESNTGIVPGNAAPNAYVNIYYPPGNWNGYLLAVKANVTFLNGQSCEVIKLLPMDCGLSRREVSLSPNPTSDIFTINSNDTSDIINIDIKNMYGKLIKNVKSNYNAHINISSNPPGMYFIEIRYKDGTSTIKKLILKN